MMDAEEDTLWRRSSAWRWLVAAAVISTVLLYTARPDREQIERRALPAAQFNTPGSPGAVGAAPMQPAVINENSSSAGDGTDQLYVPATFSGAALPAVTASINPGVYMPPARSRVVWSSTGGVSGGGLVAEYCCAGAFGVVLADTSVRSGTYYWELTFSASPGKDHPDTWTNAGVTIAKPGSDVMQKVIPGRSSSAGSGSAESFSTIDWGQWKNIANGDVFMFALDADRSLIYHGINGIWLNGTPGAQGGVQLGSRGDSYTPYATLSSPSSNPGRVGDRWIANFGASAFRFAIPAGFAAYGTNTRVMAPPASGGPAAAGGVQGGFINAHFQSEVEIGGRKIPLPDGDWIGLAFFRGASGTARGDAAVLGRFEGNRLKQMIAVNAYAHPPAAQSGFPGFSACDRQDYAFIDRRSNEAYGEQRCWWINHTVNLWRQPVFQAARSVLDSRGITPPDVLMNVAIHGADKGSFITVFHYFDPADAGIRSSAVSWHNSEWFRDRIAADPRRVAYVKELRDWGKSWAPVVFAYR